MYTCVSILRKFNLTNISSPAPARWCTVRQYLPNVLQALSSQPMTHASDSLQKQHESNPHRCHLDTKSVSTACCCWMQVIYACNCSEAAWSLDSSTCRNVHYNTFMTWILLAVLKLGRIPLRLNVITTRRRMASHLKTDKVGVSLLLRSTILSCPPQLMMIIKMLLSQLTRNVSLVPITCLPSAPLEIERCYEVCSIHALYFSILLLHMVLWVKVCK